MNTFYALLWLVLSAMCAEEHQHEAATACAVIAVMLVAHGLFTTERTP